MERPNDILLRLTRYVHPVVLFLLLLCVSHLLLPVLASLSGGSYIFEKVPNHISFLFDWPYHLIWLGIIAPVMMLIYLFHGRTKGFVHDVVGDYEANYNEFARKVYIPVISLVIASLLSFLYYRVNGLRYMEKGITTWWLPYPDGRLALVTVAFHIWGAVIGSTALVYVIDHLAVSMYLHRLLGSWNKDFILKTERTDLIDRLNSMVKHFTAPVYVLLPAAVLGLIIIKGRKFNLTDPAVVVTLILITAGLFLLYFIPVVISGLASKIAYAKLLRPDVRDSGLGIFPTQRGFWLVIFAPIWSAIATRVVERLI